MKSRKFKATLSILLAVIMVLGQSTFAAQAAVGKDVAGHWSAPAIEKCNQYGIMNGYDGYFRPNDPITTAEFCTMVNAAFGFTETSGAKSFTDVPADAWYKKQIDIASAMGYMTGIGGGKTAPESNISRERAFTILARVYKLVGDENAKTRFSDDASISAWARGSVAAFADAGYVSGYQNKVSPQATITRGETAQILCNIFGEIADASASAKTTYRNLTIRKPGVTLENAVVNGDLYITEGVGLGDVTLNNVTVKGRLLVSGGGPASVHATNCTLSQVIIDNGVLPLNTHVDFGGNTTVKQVNLNSTSSVTQGNATIAYDENTGKMTFGGEIDKIALDKDGNAVVTVGGITYLVIPEKKADGTGGKITGMELASGAVVKTVEVSSPVAVSGSGKIESMAVHTSGVVIGGSVDVKPERIVTDNGIHLTIGGKDYIGTGEKSVPVSSTSGDSSGGYTPPSPTVYTVTFNTQNNLPATSQFVTSGQKATKPSDPTKTGFAFTGWFTAAAGGTAFDFNTPITANTTIYAQWASYTITASASAITYGQTLASSTITPTSATAVADNSPIPGTWAWMVGTIAPTAGTHNYAATFTPTDTAYEARSFSVSVTVDKKVITAITGVTANNKVYDGTTDATLGTIASSLELVNGDTSLTITGGTGSFADKNVASGISVTYSGGITLTGQSDDNYILDSSLTVSSATANITPRDITAISGITAANKVYDHTTTATPDCTGTIIFTNIVTGDVLSIASVTTGTFDNKNVGTGKTVTFTGITLGGTDAGNYTLDHLSANPTATANITPIQLVMASPTDLVKTKAYDAETSTSVTMGAATNKGTDDVVIQAAANFDTVTVGQNKTITVVYTISGGADAGNYTDPVNFTTNDGEITKAQPGISVNPTVNTMDYGTTIEDNLLIGGSAVALDGVTAVPGTFTFVTTGSALSVATTTIDVTFTPTDTTNFEVITPISIPVQVNKKVVTITPDASQSKIYGAADPTFTYADISSQLVNSDTTMIVSGTLGRDSGNNVGEYAFALGSLSAGNNYQLTLDTNAPKFEITKKAITAINGFTATSKEYDGTTDANGHYDDTSITFLEVVSGDTLTLSGGTFTFDNKNVADATCVKYTGFSLTGSSAGNYELSSTLSTSGITASALITQKPITAITGLTATKEYDGSTTGTATINTVTGSDLIGNIDGTNLSVTASTAVYADSAVGTGKSVTFSGFSFSGSEAGNYSAPANVTLNSGVITVKTLTLGTPNVSSVTIDPLATSPVTFTVAVNGLVAGDNLVITNLGVNGNVKYAGTPSVTYNAGVFTVSIPSNSGNTSGTDSGYTVSLTGLAGTNYSSSGSQNVAATAAGTQGNPILVTQANIGAFNTYANTAAGLTQSYKLTQNIDLSSYGNWTPIGNNSNKFTGTFDGGNQIISGLSVTSCTSDIGLFGVVNGGSVCNLGLSNLNINMTSSFRGVGGIVGYAENTQISNCFTSGTISITTTKSNNVGGIVGNGALNSTVSNCYSSATVTLSTSSANAEYAGGIVGYLTSGSILNCYATGSVSSTSQNTNYEYAGGIAGANGGTITNCVALNSNSGGNAIKGTADKVGRIGNSGTYVNCHADSAMQVNGAAVTGGTTTNKNGADVASGVAAGQYNNQAWWSTTAGWTINAAGTGSENSPWEWGTNNLPKLWFE